MKTMFRIFAGGRALGLAVAIAAAASLGATAARAEGAAYRLDPEHSTIGFLVDHIGFARVMGKFTDVSGEFTFDEKAPALSGLRVVVRTESVWTGHGERDKHLRGKDFLDVGNFPDMVFVGRRAEATGPRTGRIEGDLTLLGRTRPLTLEVTWNKSGRYPFGGGLLGEPNYVTGISARGSIRRSEFGMTYAVENGWVGDRIDLILEVEAIRQ